MLIILILDFFLIPNYGKLLNQHVEMTYNHCLSALEYSFQQFLEMLPYFHACKLISVFFFLQLHICAEGKQHPPTRRPFAKVSG